MRGAPFFSLLPRGACGLFSGRAQRVAQQECGDLHIAARGVRAGGCVRSTTALWMVEEEERWLAGSTLLDWRKKPCERARPCIVVRTIDMIACWGRAVCAGCWWAGAGGDGLVGDYGCSAPTGRCDWNRSRAVERHRAGHHIGHKVPGRPHHGHIRPS